MEIKLSSHEKYRLFINKSINSLYKAKKNNDSDELIVACLFTYSAFETGLKIIASESLEQPAPKENEFHPPLIDTYYTICDADDQIITSLLNEGAYIAHTELPYKFTFRNAEDVMLKIKKIRHHLTHKNCQLDTNIEFNDIIITILLINAYIPKQSRLNNCLENNHKDKFYYLCDDEELRVSMQYSQPGMDDMLNYNGYCEECSNKTVTDTFSHKDSSNRLIAFCLFCHHPSEFVECFRCYENKPEGELVCVNPIEKNYLCENCYDKHPKIFH